MAMINLPPDFKEFLKLLREKCVEYLLIGGYAVAYHDYPGRPPISISGSRFALKTLKS
jgi:hypothetical protein